MIATHFRTAFRHLIKSKIFTIINVTGLTVGLTAFFLILQYLNFELSFDRFHKNHQQIYRVAYEQIENNEVKKSSAGTFFGVGNFLREHFSEVEHVVRFYKWPANTGAVLMANDKVFNERSYFFAEESFFKVFQSLLIEGDANTCLSKPNSIVLSKSLAKKMFDDESPLGKEIKRLDLEDTWLTVTGIMEDTPPNSHFDLDLVIPYDKDWIPDREGIWKFPNNLTYLSLKDDVDPLIVESRLNEAMSKEQKGNPAFNGAKCILQPLTDIHFSSYQEEEIGTSSNKQTVMSIGIAAIVILFLAWINYVNLETSRFLTRIREVGVRRVIGSSRSQLISQFFIQYACLAAISVMLSTLLIWQLRPFYFQLTGGDFLPLSASILWPTILALGIFLTGSIITGIYPALFLIRLNPIHCINGKVFSSVSSGKKSLLGFQLVASLLLLSFLAVVWQQLNFMLSTRNSMGLDRVLTIYNSTSYSVQDDSLKREKSVAFRNILLQNTNFENVSTSSVIPGEPIGFTYRNLTKRSLTDPDDNVAYKVIFVDNYFIPVYKLPLKAGRNYSADSGEDNNGNSLVLNESAVKALGFKSAEEAVDKEIYFKITFDWKKYKIIGVTEDYRHESVKMPTYPTIFYLHQYVGQMTYYSVQIKADADMKTCLAQAETTWKEIWPEKPFDYAFADQKYDRQFKSEIYLSRIFLAFSTIAVFLASLGVLGMTLFEVTARQREVSIRKILGASVAGLISLLSKDLVKVTGIATILALPMSYWFAVRWLERYPVRVELSLFIFLVPLTAILVLVLFVSTLNTLRAASANPIDHLKSE